MGMLTLTAPGSSSHQRWRVYRGSEHVDCSCHEGVDLAEWNADHSVVWNRLRTSLARLYPDMEYLRGVEVQERGAIHDHVILWSSEPVDVERVQALALLAGYGCVMHWAPCEPGSRKAAYYVSKYVTKSCDSRADVPWRKVDRSTGELLGDKATFRTWSASQEWGLTMRDVKCELQRFAVASAARFLDGRVELVASVLGGVVVTESPPPT